MAVIAVAPALRKVRRNVVNLELARSETKKIDVKEAA
jgi:hypothetical protein